MITDEILPTSHSGGATTSHTVLIPALAVLLDFVEPHGSVSDYQCAVLERNVLGKDTTDSRKRTFRYLRELYLLRSDSVLFRALRDLWDDDRQGRPLLAGLCALARDPVFRASASAVLAANPGDQVVSADLAESVGMQFPTAYNERTLAKIGRNTFSSWEQTGHLKAVARTMKVRQRPVCSPAALAFALLLGHLEGIRGEALFETLWARVLDLPRRHLLDLAMIASRRSLIDFRHSGGITVVGFTELLHPIEGQIL